jgi:transcriptional regulator with GAF, ATPase, and Fis domain
VNSTATLRESLNNLRTRLKRLDQQGRSVEHERFVQLLVRVIPKALEAERCGIFFVDPETLHVWSRYGTGLKAGSIDFTDAGSVVAEVMKGAAPIIIQSSGPGRTSQQKAAKSTGFQTRNMIAVPVPSRTSSDPTGVIQVLNRVGESPFTADDVEILEEVASALSLSLENILLTDEIGRLSHDLAAELTALTPEGDVAKDPFVATSPRMDGVRELIQSVSLTPVSVLITGENGTGKEVVAKTVHARSDRRHRPMISVNCAAIPETLVESEFFGHDRGAFTGAVKSRGGYFEAANRTTLFLDEVGDLPLSMQAKFLRVLQEREGQRIGSSQIRTYDFRLIAATNRDLKAMVEAGTFREDLYYRLFSIEISLPPLRDRPEDIEVLSGMFLQEVCSEFGKRIPGLSPSVQRAFRQCAWPGNVRQLRREIERLVALTPNGESAGLHHCSEAIAPRSEDNTLERNTDGTLPEAIAQLERSMIAEAMGTSAGNKSQAARRLGIPRLALYKKLKLYELE